MQLKEEEERIEEGEADTRKKLKAMRDHNKEGEGTRETRVSRQTLPCVSKNAVKGAGILHSCRVSEKSMVSVSNLLQVGTWRDFVSKKKGKQKV